MCNTSSFDPSFSDPRFNPSGHSAFDAPYLAEHASLHGLFEEHAIRNPDAIAVICGPYRICYRELNQRASLVARGLLQRGVESEEIVGLCVDRSVDLLVGILGILKAGAAYLPLDPAQPCERLAGLVAGSGVRMAIVQTAQDDRLARCEIQRLSLEMLNDDGDSAQRPISVKVAGRNLAYVMYTSGSTGCPKGVMIEHAAVVNTILDVNRRFQVRGTDRVLALSSFGFDLSVYDYFGMLAAGGAVVLPQAHRAAQPAHWAELVRQHGVTIWNSVPTSLELFIAQAGQGGDEHFESLRLVMLSGDWIPVGLPGKFRDANPQTRVVSLGGATEASIWSILYPIADVDSNWKSIPYGRAMHNQSINVLDAQLRPCQGEDIGQLYIGGSGLARGYLNQPELTAQRFIEDPAAHGGGARLYATGDLGRMLPDGNIEFLGRVDNQVKIRGFRIELGEIEMVLCRHPAVGEAVVVPREPQPGRKLLAAYVVPKGMTNPTAEELRRFLRRLLPEYMLPAQFSVIDQLPLGANGKVDRRALSALGPSDFGLSVSPVLPASLVEEQLVRIWEEAFGHAPIGVEDDFYQLGGNSMMAAGLVARIAEELGYEVALDSFIEMPKIRQLSCHLSDPEATPRSPIVAIQPTGLRPPLFCVPGLAGSLMEFHQLAVALGPKQPMFGFPTRGIDGRQSPGESIREIASEFLGALRGVQPSGPYYLGGYSLGGVIAYEMAAQLVAQRERVGLLALFDSELWDSRQCLVRRFIQHLRFFWRQDGRRRWRYVQKKIRSLVRGSADRTLPQNLIAVMNLPPSSSRIAQRQLQALQNYRPPAYPDRLTLFVAEKRAKQASYAPFDPSLGWSRWAKSVDIHVSSGDHMNLLRQPHVDSLAAKLSMCLDRALGAGKRL